VTVSDQGLLAADSGLVLPGYGEPGPGNHPPLDFPCPS
jgi:hypothetical protein